MRASALASRLAVSLVAAAALDAPAVAQNGIFLPQSPIGPGGEDSIETSDGTRCRQSINNNGAYADAGVVGNKVRQPDYRGGGVALLNDGSDYALGYFRVTIPLGPKPRRLDCTRLYEMELTRLRREIELLKMNPE